MNIPISLPLLIRQSADSSQSASKIVSIPKIGPIELPLFIVLCFFGPFFLGFFMWIFYLYTFKKCADRRNEKENIENSEQEKSYDVEMQLQGLRGKNSGRKFEEKGEYD